MTKETTTTMTPTTMSISQTLGRNRRLGLRAALLAIALFAASALAAAPALADFGFQPGASGFDGVILNRDGSPATQAGSRPYEVVTGFTLNTTADSEGNLLPDGGSLKDAVVSLPPGFVGNTQVVPQCPLNKFLEVNPNNPYGGPNCADDTAVGVMKINIGFLSNVLEVFLPLHSLVPSRGVPARFGTTILGVQIFLSASVRTGDDYGLDIAALDVPQGVQVLGATTTFWGVPADPSHDFERGACIGFFGPNGPECSAGLALEPFISQPTSCQGQTTTTIRADSWSEPGDFVVDSFLSHDNSTPTPQPVGNTGCNALPFEPELEARPTTNVADSASGLDVDLHVPQPRECKEELGEVNCENAAADVKDATLTLPAGLVLNPAGANGLAGCSEADFGYTETGTDGTIHTTPEPATCPDASKQGTVEVDTPLLSHPMKGAVYLAQPYQNPFGSLIALYVSVDDPETGIVAKLAGEAQLDPNTGQVTTSFKQSPQLPFEDFKLNLFGGASGPLRTPAVCGTYSSDSSMTPWTAPEGETKSWSDPWAIERAPAGSGSCPGAVAQVPNVPSLDAGSISPVAALSTPTVVNLRRDDGTQEFSTVSLTLPPGLTGKLAGVGYCPDSALAAAASKSGREEEASASCPASSRIGRVDVSAGAGPAPYNGQGTAYLTGPYKGAPLGMAIVTPATAGPFDLGTVVVRAALHLNSTTGQITATTDPLPRILQGIPLDIRSARVLLDRQSFTRNGTSCDPSSFAGNLVSVLNQSASLAERFQLGECSSLSFKPKLSIRLSGATKRGGHPALTGKLTMPDGGANLAEASFALPHSEFLDQGHIGTVCTRVQFTEGAGNGANCPPASAYGRAIATSPLVDYALEGPAILRSSSHKLPDLVLALHGPASQPIAVEAVGRIDSVKGGIRTTFEGAPDLPVSKVVLRMAGGKKGLLQNSTDICQSVNRATAKLNGQNGKVVDLSPALKSSRCRKAKRQGKHGRATR
jgi:hypothetical protein